MPCGLILSTLVASGFAMLLAIASPAANADTATSQDGAIDDACWSISFEDDFDELSLYNEVTGEGRWRTRYIWPRDVIINEEEQFYVDPAEHGLNPFDIDNGVLNITASPTPADRAGAFLGQPYISGVLTTEKSFAQRYGRFEVRARVPQGQGLWSAFWLLPSFDQWPEGVEVLPEIDVMEHLGNPPNEFHTTLHTNQAGQLDSYPYDHTLDTDLTQDFHVYAVIWDAQNVRWYLDGAPVAKHATPKDFTEPVHLLLNLAVGGTWPGAPDDTTPFPARYAVDRVTVYEPSGSCS